MKRVGTVGAIALAAALALGLLTAGCLPKSVVQPLEPKVKPPVIGEAGTLRAVIDLSVPPFGGKIGEEQVGLDVDVASAVANRLGLKLEIVDATPTVGATLLREGKVDILLGGLRIDQAVQEDVAFAGPYLNDAPAIFSAAESTRTLESIAGTRIAAQTGSLASWVVADEYGDDMVTGYPTLDEAFRAVEAGRADFAVGDGVVGIYMRREHPKMFLNGQLQPAVPVGIAVAKDKPELETVIRQALDEMSSGGILETLRRKWLGDAVRFEGSVEDTASLEATVTIEATETP